MANNNSAVSMRVVLGLVLGMLGFGAVTAVWMTWQWDRLPWSSAAVQRRLAMTNLANSVSIGDRVQAVRETISGKSGVKVMEVDGDSTVFRVQPHPVEFLESEWVVHFMIDQERVVGIGVRTRDNNWKHPNGSPFDRVISASEERWTKLFGFNPVVVVVPTEKHLRGTSNSPSEGSKGEDRQ